MNELTLVPAYGRDYKNESSVLKDWKGGKDFKISTIMSKWNGAYCSIRDIKEFPGKYIKIRYNQLQDFVLIPLTKDN